VFNASDWSGFADWQSSLTDSDLATYASIDSDTSIVTWVVPLLEADYPSDAQCEAYATALAAGDLASGLVVAAEFYDQEINLDADSTAYASLVSLGASSVLLAERFDSSCIGYKFFSYYDSPTEFSETTGIFSD